MSAGVTCRSDVVSAVVEVCGIKPELLVDDADLESLEIDSLDLIEIGMIVEEQYDTTIDSQAFAEVTTFGGAVAAFDQAIAADPAS